MPRQEEEVCVSWHIEAFDGHDLTWLRFKSRGQTIFGIVGRSPTVDGSEVVRALKTHDHASQVALGIEVGKQYALTLQSKHPTQIEGRRGLTDAAFMVEETNDLSHGGCGT
jgi:hypothetical protein